MKEIFFILFLFISVKPLEKYSDSHKLILNDESSTIDGVIVNSTIFNGVSFDNGIISIKSAGTYILSGSLKGQVFVSAGLEDRIILVLNGVSIYSESNHALRILTAYEIVKNYTYSYSYAKSLDGNDAGIKIIIADGTKNRIEGKRSASADGAIRCFTSLLITGETKGDGVLNIIGKKEGIETQKFLFINGGILNISAQDDGINVKGKYFCIINGGKILINSGLGKEGDGIDSNGSILINGGEIIAAGHPLEDGLNIVDDIIIDGGNVFSVGFNTDTASTLCSQPTMNLFFSMTIFPSSTITIKDSDGNEIISYCADTENFISGTNRRNYTAAVVSHSSFKVNSAYHIYLDGIQLGFTRNDKNSNNSEETDSIIKTDFILGPGATDFSGIQKAI